MKKKSYKRIYEKISYSRINKILKILKKLHVII